MDGVETTEHVNGLNNENVAEHKSKEEALAELRHKELGKKHEITKIDFASNLKKTKKPDQMFREKKKSNDGPNYLENLKKTESGVTTQPEYIRLAKQAELEGKHIERKYTAEELINMAFRKADDADTRDPAARRGITQKHAAAPGTFEGIKVTNDEKEDYKSVLKQHVSVEPRLSHKVEENKPSWANITPKRVIEVNIRNNSRENKQEKPEWAQFGRGATKHIVELEQTKQTGRSQAPEWANLVKTDPKRFSHLEQKKGAGNNDSGQPEWAAKSRDPREVLRVERKPAKKSSSSEDTPDYKGVLRRGSRKE